MTATLHFIPFSSRDGYKTLEAQIKDLYKINDEINSHLTENPVKQLYFKAKNSVLGKKEHTVKELLHLQRSRVRTLRQGLQNHTEQATESLERITIFIEERQESFAEGLQEAKTHKENYYKSIEHFQKEREKKETTYEKERTLKTIARTVRETRYQRSLALEKIADLDQEKVYLEYKEKFITNAVHLAQKLLDKTRRFEEHLDVTCDTYDTMLKHGKLQEALLEAVTTYGSYIHHLDNILVEMQSTLAQNLSSTDDLYDVQGKDLIDNVEELNTERTRELESIVKKYKL